MSEQVFIQVRFKESTVVGEYSDALYFTQAEYASKQQSEIDSLKQARTTNWVNVVKNPPPFVEPTKAELQAQKAELQKQIAELDIKIGSK